MELCLGGRENKIVAQLVVGLLQMPQSEIFGTIVKDQLANETVANGIGHVLSRYLPPLK